MRNLLLKIPSDSSLAVFYQSSLWSKGWYDADSTATDDVFGTLIENVVGGRSRLEEAIGKARPEIEAILNK